MYSLPACQVLSPQTLVAVTTAVQQPLSGHLHQEVPPLTAMLLDVSTTMHLQCGAAAAAAAYNTWQQQL